MIRGGNCPHFFLYLLPFGGICILEYACTEGSRLDQWCCCPVPMPKEAGLIFCCILFLNVLRHHILHNLTVNTPVCCQTLTLKSNKPNQTLNGGKFVLLVCQCRPMVVVKKHLIVVCHHNHQPCFCILTLHAKAMPLICMLITWY